VRNHTLEELYTPQRSYIYRDYLYSVTVDYFSCAETNQPAVEWDSPPPPSDPVDPWTAQVKIVTELTARVQKQEDRVSQEDSTVADIHKALEDAKEVAFLERSVLGSLKEDLDHHTTLLRDLSPPH